MKYIRSIFLLSFFIGLAGCSSPLAAAPTPTAIPRTSTPVPTLPPTATLTPTLTATATQPACNNQPGVVENGSLASSKPPQQFLIYLPPCYEDSADARLPVLYLLHGQTYTDDEWVRMGATKVADNLIHSHQVAPFIMVFPDDRYWNLPAGPGFGDRLLNLIIPYVDENYRTIPDARYRALGGLSRGGGWAIHMALTEYATFGIIGLHSPVIFDDDSAMLEKLFASVPPNAWPHIWLDGGDHDGELGNILRFEGLLTTFEVPHEWRLYSGDHTEKYWTAHLAEYLLWYSQQFAGASAATPSPTATP